MNFSEKADLLENELPKVWGIGDKIGDNFSRGSPFKANSRVKIASIITIAQ